MVQQPPVSQGLLIVEASQSHTDTPQSVGLLWTSDQPDAENSTSQHPTLIRDIRVPIGVRTRNHSKRAAADSRVKTAWSSGSAPLSYSRNSLCSMDSECTLLWQQKPAT